MKEEKIVDRVLYISHMVAQWAIFSLGAFRLSFQATPGMQGTHCLPGNLGEVPLAHQMGR